ncbi:MAG: class B sortase [Ruminococcaceae bacterium]|nr:class B sortase [Oscillospiraceae bacterium]
MSGFIINENAFDDENNNNNKPNKSKKNSRKKKILDLIIVLLATVFVFCVCYIGRYYWQSLRNDGLNEDLIDGAVNYGDSSDSQDAAVDSAENSNDTNGNKGGSSGKKKEVKVPESIDFEKLKAQNKDVVGWIFSKNGVINYPILQGDDNSYYLNHLISGKKNINGSIFMDYTAKSDFSGYNTVIYGHSMDNGSMFRTLLNYKKQSYYDKYPEIYIYTPNGNYRMIIFAAYETKHDDLVFGKVYSEKGVEKLINHAISKSKIKTKVEVSSKDKIVSLSTCAYSSKNARCIVMGKLVPADFSSSSQNESNLSQNDTNISNSVLFD